MSVPTEQPRRRSDALLFSIPASSTETADENKCYKPAENFSSKPLRATQSTKPKTEASQRGRLDYCDGLRGWFAMLVVLHHFQSINWKHTTPDYNILYGPGFGVGINGFFILSSFLLTYRLAGEMLSYKTTEIIPKSICKSIAFFAIRRIFRIYPLFWFIGSASLISPWFLGSFERERFWGYFKYHLPAFFSLYSTSSAFFWTLSVELKSYTIIPFVCICARFATASAIRRSAFLAGLMIGIISSHVAWGPVTQPGSDLAPWISVFLTGATIGILYVWRERGIRPFVLLQCTDVCIKQITSAVATALFVLTHATTSLQLTGLLEPVHRSLTYNYLTYSVWPGYVLAIVFLLAISSSGQGAYFTNFFASKIMRFIGRISYSLYLLHFAVIEHTNQNVPEILRYRLGHLFILILAGLALSAVSFKFVEEPAMDAGTQLIRLIRHHLGDASINAPLGPKPYSTHALKRFFCSAAGCAGIILMIWLQTGK